MTSPEPVCAECRREAPGDESGIRLLLRECFPGELEARLVDSLREAGRLTLSCVACIDGQIVGHLAFSPVTHRENDVGLGLAPLAVHARVQRRGVGRALVEFGLAECRQRGDRAVFVLGDPAYYARFGFLPAAHWSLEDRFGGGDAFQVLELSPGTLPRGGHIEYAAEFNQFL